MDALLDAAARAQEVTRQISAPSSRRAAPAASRILLLAAAAVLLPASVGTAGGPLLTEDGEPYRWDTKDPVALNLDQGPLGAISQNDARSAVELAIQEWNAVGTSEFRFELGDSLPVDVEDYSENKFYNFVTKNDGTNPVIYDSSGAITDDIFGPGSGVLGAAGPSLLVPSSAKLVKGFAIFNGKEFTENSTSILRAVITHELGHFLGLGHSQTNGTRVGSTIPGFLGTVETADVETMFPLLIEAAEEPHPMSTLHKDDMAAISTLYPTPAFQATTGGLRGDVYDFDGTTPLQGVNVIARNVADPFADAVSCVSGALAGGGLAGSGLGGWALRGLTPGATYLVYVEEVGGYFVGGASIGPLDPPLDVDPTDLAAFLEFWSGEDESAENPPDDPSAGQGILVEAGRTLGEFDFLFNGTAPRVYALTPSSGLYDAPQQIRVTGANFLDVISVRLDSPIPIYLEGVEAPAPNTLTAWTRPGSDLVPGTYPIIVTTFRGENRPSDITYTVTEPLPVVLLIDPETIENDRARRVALEGTDLLGTKSARLEAPGLPPVDLEILRVFDAATVLTEVPAGTYPGSYRAVATNTEGEGLPSEALLGITELPPVLSGLVDPPSGNSSRPRTVLVGGQNLTGTRQVTLLNGDTRIAATIQSTALTEITVTIPEDIEAGAYVIEVSNTAGTATGPSSYEVKPRGGGGGGCGAVITSKDIPGIDLPFLAAVLATGWLARRIRMRGRLHAGARVT